MKRKHFFALCLAPFIVPVVIKKEYPCHGELANTVFNRKLWDKALKEAFERGLGDIPGWQKQFKSRGC